MKAMEVLDITVGEPPKDGILQIIRLIRPAWDTDRVICKDVLGGHVNRLYSCSLPEDTDECDVVLIRIYGPAAAYIIDKEREVLAMTIANHVGLASPVYCRFNNGLALKYHRGHSVTTNNQTDEKVARGVAKAIARLHRLDYKEVLGELGQVEKAAKFNLRTYSSGILPFPLPDLSNTIGQVVCEKTTLMSSSEATAELSRLERLLTDFQFPQVLCHNDLNTGNIVYNGDSGEVHLVDWDLAEINIPVYDIGVFFASHCYSSGNESGEDLLKLYPDKDYRRTWLRWYLEYKDGTCGDKQVEDDILNKYLRGADLAAMYWTLGVSLWAMGTACTFPKEAVFQHLAEHFQNIFRTIKKEQMSE